ncbi:MAG: pyridoxamine 5'-phosphate oxidase [Candidatus Pelagibacter sp.]|nr:pyridoxamine 5'-phosphate oxidase [Candidatus Pelagibacter sp.]OUW23735.1 MAG: pyridoxamine 5'-phosphate oxidase [Rickettsiales bacterium TMED174]|tara:strand:+ start:338 stop:970 length:633 start_codon:yes stop_codon:yes gene_type:complete
MNQKNGKNSLGIDKCFEDLENPIDLFNNWFKVARNNEINDPNALALATSNIDNQPNVRMVLLKGINEKGFVFYTNLSSRKGEEIKKNKKASMCFHWKSIRRQVRILGELEKVSDNEADKYYNSRPYKNKIGAWASTQSEKLENREKFLKEIENFEKKYPENKSVPRPPYWSGWRLIPKEIEFWLDGEGRIHERLIYKKNNILWERSLLYP